MRPQSRSSAGFTLVETVVASVLVLTALLLAAGLFTEATRLFKASAGELGKPLTGLAAERLRKDLQNSTALLALSSGWSTGPLVLIDDGKVVTYADEGEELVRRVVDSSAQLVASEVAFHHLLLWRWQASGANLVEIEIVYGTPADLSRFRLDESPTRPEPGVQRERFLLALRGGGRASGW